MVFTEFENLSAVSQETQLNVCRLFEAQVHRQPTATAIEFMGQRWTYQTLNAHANQLAHYLRTQGVGPDVLVGLYLDRSFEMVVGLLAILKAGGAYIPLDPSYPSERLAWILKDSGVSVLLSQTSLKDSLISHPANIIYLDSIAKKLARQSATNPAATASVSNLAYVIYTSGSTGQPKGVLVEHGALTNFIQGANQDCGIRKCDRVLQFASISFDTAIEEIFLTLTQGATLVLRAPDMLKSVPAFLKTCGELQLTVIDLPTAFWHQICAELVTATVPDSIRLVIIGGERVLLNWLNVWKQYVSPNVRLVNGYGPTEAAVVTTYCELIGPNEIPINNGIVPIGKPLPNVQTHILDDTMSPVNIGETGALFIGGSSLARGYLGRSDLTAASFLERAFVNGREQRLYQTGDLVRCRQDGHLEFLGRADHQEKIRGFRVELSEIETVLEQHSAVQEAIVVSQMDSIGIKRLIAYVVRSRLAQQLPVADTNSDRLESELIDQWRLINNSQQLNPTKANWDDTFNISGWINSYTSELIPDIEMKEWVDSTTARILSLNPQRVLEIGCGTGLLLFRIAPHCESYLGIDISETSLNYVQQQLESPQTHLPHVTLERRTADNLQDIEPQSVDTIIINSVIQYFPSVDYLVRVLEQAVKIVKPGGTLFLGDVRNYLLLEVFAAAVELSHADDSLPTDELSRRIQKRLHQEEELTLDPGFFTALQAQIPSISRGEVLLKRGKFHNELTQFRYDVVLHIKAEVASLPPSHAQLDWQQQNYSVADLKQYIAEYEPISFSLYNIPNRRIAKATRIVETLAQSEHPATVGLFKQTLSNTSYDHAVDPEDLWQVAQTIPYTITISCLDTDSPETYNAAFTRKSPSGIVGYAQTAISTSKTPSNPLHTYANNPLHSKITQDFSLQLRAYAKHQLPSYMLPSTFVVLDKLPLTANGKIDRKALPASESARPALDVAFVAPHSSLEISLAELWSKVLNICQIGVYDSFFELGGDSLRLMQLFSLIQRHHHQEISLADFFNNPTIDYLAKQLQTLSSTIVSTVNEQIALSKLREEIILPPLEQNLNSPTDTALKAWTNPQAVLLTGATGFIGISLLNELLQQTEATIYCLIRAQSLTQAYQKLRQAAKRYLPGIHLAYSRIIPLVGDLGRPLFGLSLTQFQSIAETVDMIYHSAANVNLLYPLSRLRATNIIGTKSVLKLAAYKKLKLVHFLSTLDVFEPLVATGADIVYEADNIDQGDIMTGGYAQSKWVAEKLVSKAADQGIPICIYRPGMVTGHSRTGIGNPEDLLNRLIKSFIQVNTVPRLSLQIDMTPVDYVSQAIVYLSIQANSLNKAFHLVNPTAFHLEELTDTMNKFGLRIKSSTYNHWASVLENYSNALTPLAQVITEPIGHKQITRLEMWLSGTQLFDCSNTLTGLIGSDISCPKADHNLFAKYLSRLSS
ncbi:MAG: amino acid adenylation domain-containing protein [Leptolyngbyaceae cyanobacterium]